VPFADWLKPLDFETMKLETCIHSMTVNSQIRRKRLPRDERGYIMMTLLLMMALMVIFAAVIVPSITFDIKRDREEELIHRGVQYSRAIRSYYKKFGRYPTKIEDLENTNNLRYLRKRYKDPMNCKSSKCADFKLLHFGEVQMSLSGIGGGNIPGANPVGTTGGMNGGPTGPGGFGQPSTLGGSGGFGGTSGSTFGQNQPAAGNAQPGSDPSQPGSQTPADGKEANPAAPGNGSGSNQLGSGQIIGGPIVGVATTSKDPTIREFNHKKKYKDWVFAYDPGQDQGRLITTPYQPQLQGFGQAAPNLNGQNGSNGQPGSNSGFGTGNSFGSSPSFGSGPSGTQNPTSPNSGYGNPNPPSSSPQQQ
jgi:type II secretory pathway pseudopilin PulG